MGWNVEVPDWTSSWEIPSRREILERFPRFWGITMKALNGVPWPRPQQNRNWRAQTGLGNTQACLWVLPALWPSFSCPVFKFRTPFSIIFTSPDLSLSSPLIFTSIFACIIILFRFCSSSLCFYNLCTYLAFDQFTNFVLPQPVHSLHLILYPSGHRKVINNLEFQTLWTLWTHQFPRFMKTVTYNHSLISQRSSLFFSTTILILKLEYSEKILNQYSFSQRWKNTCSE